MILCCVQRGKLDVVADDGKQIYVTLNDGAVFGEVKPLLTWVVDPAVLVGSVSVSRKEVGSEFKKGLNKKIKISFEIELFLRYSVK